MNKCYHKPRKNPKAAIMDPRLYKNLEVGDKLEIQVTGLTENYEATIVGFDNSAGRHPLIKITNNDSWKRHVLRDGDYIIKKVLTLDKCDICGAETSYTKDTPIEQRPHYDNDRQICSECANKKD